MTTMIVAKPRKVSQPNRRWAEFEERFAAEAEMINCIVTSLQRREVFDANSFWNG
jgi:hypothetical protein